MIFMIIFSLIGLVCIGISAYLSMKAKKGIGPNFLKAEIIKSEPSNDKYLITVAYQQKDEWKYLEFEYEVPFPEGSFVDFTLEGDQVILYSKPIKYSEIFKVLTTCEKWRYLGVCSFAIGALCTLIQSGKATAIVIGLVLSSIAIISLFVALKCQKNYRAFIDQEREGNIDFIEGHVIGRVDKTAYVTYKNNFNQTFTVTLPSKHANGDDIQMMHHIPSDTLIHVSKKSLKIQNVIFLSIAGILGVITLVLFIWFKGQTG